MALLLNIPVTLCVLSRNAIYLLFISNDNYRACDACEDWYHGDCIGISEREAKYIKHYYCEVFFIF